MIYGEEFIIKSGLIWNYWVSVYQLPWSWFLTNLNYCEKQISITQKSISVPFSAVGKVLVFWWSSEIFCKFWPRFCINHFIALQNRKHEKRLGTDVPSLESSVFMRIFIAVFTFGDRCSTNWAIPLYSLFNARYILSLNPVFVNSLPIYYCKNNNIFGRLMKKLSNTLHLCHKT